MTHEQQLLLIKLTKEFKQLTLRTRELNKHLSVTNEDDAVAAKLMDAMVDSLSNLTDYYNAYVSSLSEMPKRTVH